MDPDARPVYISGSHGFQVGDGNVQHNTFVTKQPAPPPAHVVAGSIPQAPPVFQPREDLMAQLRAGSHGVSAVRALTGMRGVGKTQLAAAYARECVAAGWRIVAWVHAETTGELLDGLAVVADRLGIDGPDGTALESIGAAVRNRLEAGGELSLIVFDNVTDLAAVRPYLPSSGACQVVITSTLKVTTLGRALPVDVFTEQESRAFLAERTARDDPDGAAVLAAELGHLPLALAQAAAVIAAQRLTYQVYLDRLRSLPLRDYLTAGESGEYPRGVAEAVLLSVDAVTSADQSGLCDLILGLICVLSPARVSRDLLYRSDRDASPQLMDEALAGLAKASLLAFTADDSAVTAHRLITRVIRERRARDGMLLPLGARACILLEEVAGSLGEPWQQRAAARNFVQLAAALNDHIGPYLRAEDAELAVSLLYVRGDALGYLLALRDSAQQAVELGEPLLAESERLLGASHPDTVLARHNLAGAYLEAGRVDEAIPLLERALTERAGDLGETHPDTLVSLLGLASAYESAGRGEAVGLYERALAGFEQVLGNAHPDTLASRNSLAVAYLRAGRAGDAIGLLERVLAQQERVPGDSHPIMLVSRGNLAGAYLEAGRVNDAVSLYESVLEEAERWFGPEHPQAVMFRGNLEDARQRARRRRKRPWR